MMEISFKRADRPYKVGDYKLTRQKFFAQTYWIMQRTWYGWKRVRVLSDYDAALLELKELERLKTIERNFL
jgi:hypothetical protein